MMRCYFIRASSVGARHPLGMVRWSSVPQGTPPPPIGTDSFDVSRHPHADGERGDREMREKKEKRKEYFLKIKIIRH